MTQMSCTIAEMVEEKGFLIALTFSMRKSWKTLAYQWIELR
jgi:hypothetical protein